MILINAYVLKMPKIHTFSSVGFLSTVSFGNIVWQKIKRWCDTISGLSRSQINSRTVPEE